MTFTKTDRGYLIRLFKDEPIVESLKSFCEKENIPSAIFHAIGALQEPDLAYYDLETKEYLWKHFSGMWEIVSMTGNIVKLEGKPFVHVHTVISGREMETFGGHLKEAKAGATTEIFLTPFDKEITRVKDEMIGLNLLHLENNA